MALLRQPAHTCTWPCRFHSLGIPTDLPLSHPFCSCRTNFPRTLLCYRVESFMMGYADIGSQQCSKGLEVPCTLHDSWANAKSCRDLSRLFKDYNLLSVFTWVGESIGMFKLMFPIYVLSCRWGGGTLFWGTTAITDNLLIYVSSQ